MCAGCSGAHWKLATFELLGASAHSASWECVPTVHAKLVISLAMAHRDNVLLAGPSGTTLSL